jgi:hypothetical protein
MTTPTWNQIAAPNFSAGNDLIAQAMEQLSKATTGFKSIADQYKDTVQKRNLGLIQEYVNSAKTPEELQSEAFKTGLANLTGNMGGDYDTLAKAQLVDKAYDSLLSRKANQVSIASNEFNLDTAKKTQLTKDYTNKILAAPPEQRDALRQAAIDAGAFDFGGVTAGDLAIAQLLGTTQQNKLREMTWDDQVKAFKLANDKLIAETKDIETDNNTARYNAETERLKTLAAAEKARQEKENTKNDYISTGVAAIDAAKQKVIQQVYGSGLNTDGSKTLGEWVRLKKEEGNDPLPEYIQYLITSHPKLKSQPENIQSLYATKVYNEFSDRRALYNPVGWMTDANKEKVQSLLTNVVQDFEQQVKTAEVNATAPLYKKLVLEHAQKTGAKSTYAAAQDLGLDELTIYKSGIPSQLAAEAKIKYASSDKSIPEDQFIENEINIATNPDYASLNKPLFPEPAANTIPQSSSSFLNKLGTGSSAEKVAQVPSEYAFPKDKNLELHEKVLPYMLALLKDSKDAGMHLKITSAYRSFGEQGVLKQGYTVVYGKGTANQFSADQGYSEHQLGTTVDFTTDETLGNFNKFKTTQEYKWLQDNAYKYGFTLSYPEGNTYYQFEPWHWRFVGKNLARRLQEDKTFFYDLDQRVIDNYLISIFD